MGQPEVPAPADWEHDYRAGMTLNQLAERYGRDASTIGRALRKRGVPMRPRGRVKGLPSGQPPQHVERNADIVHDATVVGLTFNEIGRRNGISRERVRQLLQRAGIDPRSLVAERKALRGASSALRICPWCQEAYTKGSKHWRKGAHEGRYGIRISDDEHARWVAAADDYRAGMRVVDILAKYNLSAPTLTRIRRVFDIPARRPELEHAVLPTRAQSAARRAAILEAFEQGEEPVAIARRFGVSDALVNNFIRAAGLPPRRRHGRNLSDAEVNEIVARHTAGESFRAISHALGRPRATVSGAYSRWQHETAKTTYNHPYDETPAGPDAPASAGG